MLRPALRVIFTALPWPTSHVLPSTVLAPTSALSSLWVAVLPHADCATHILPDRSRATLNGVTSHAPPDHHPRHCKCSQASWPSRSQHEADLRFRSSCGLTPHAVERRTQEAPTYTHDSDSASSNDDDEAMPLTSPPRSAVRALAFSLGPSSSCPSTSGIDPHTPSSPDSRSATTASSGDYTDFFHSSDTNATDDTDAFAYTLCKRLETILDHNLVEPNSHTSGPLPSPHAPAGTLPRSLTALVDLPPPRLPAPERMNFRPSSLSKALSVSLKRPRTVTSDADEDVPPPKRPALPKPLSFTTATPLRQHDRARTRSDVCYPAKEPAALRRAHSLRSDQSFANKVRSYDRNLRSTLPLTSIQCRRTSAQTRRSVPDRRRTRRKGSCRLVLPRLLLVSLRGRLLSFTGRVSL